MSTGVARLLVQTERHRRWKGVRRDGPGRRAWADVRGARSRYYMYIHTHGALVNMWLARLFSCVAAVPQHCSFVAALPARRVL